MSRFLVDPQGPVTPFPHYWETCVGSCHAVTALREDWRCQLRRAKADIGFRYIRFHGLLDDAMSVVVEDKRRQEVRTSFYNIDLIFDFLLEIGMKPVVELGFMPTPLASGTQTCFHYLANVTPPKDYGAWEALVRSLVAHLVDRYGVDEVRSWYFEVWNEPNLNFFWAGTQAEYFQLYQHSARAVKAVDAAIPVGGPATSINAWIPDLIAFCQKNAVPLDFISTHHYPSDDPLWKDPSMTMEEFFKIAGTYERGVLQKMTRRAKDEAGNLPLFYTEWNTSALVPDAQHDQPYAAALVAKTLADNDGLVGMYSFWTFTDIFEEGGQFGAPFHGGFGLQTIHGIPKPVYRVFEFLHKMGTQRLAVSTSGSATTAEVLATRDGNRLQILAHNHDIPGSEPQTQTVELILKGVKTAVVSLSRVDADHANPRALWESMGSPEYPNAVQLAQLQAASKVVGEPLTGEPTPDGLRLRFDLPPHGVALVNVLS